MIKLLHVMLCMPQHAMHCHDLCEAPPKASRYSGRQGWLVGSRGRGVGRQGKAGREQAWRGGLVQCQEGCALSHAIALHVMPYIAYMQPLDAQFGVGVKKFGS